MDYEEGEAPPHCVHGTVGCQDVSSSPRPSLYPILATALTHIHVGAGRSPGVVDLPVVRDPLGFFYIPGSSLKGSIKSTAAIINDCIEKDRINCGKKQGEECKEICCLLGGETGEATEAPSRLSIGDLYPLLVPVPSLSHGFLYVTSPVLIARARTITEASGNDISNTVLDKLLRWLESGTKELNKARKEKTRAIILSSDDGEEVAIGTSMLRAKKVAASLEKNVDEELKKLSRVYAEHPLEGNTVIVDDSIMPLLVERALVRLTRIRLDRSRKTVASGALWTEEYIPQFTLFVGYIADTGHEGIYCTGNLGDPIQKLISLMAPNGTQNRLLSIVVGGKETVGKGLLRLKVVTEREKTGKEG